ncbi:DUF441 domain-containing protein [Clostridium aciditolerans]|uniref:UPF0756 membrane protein I6U51_07610 n=1 Tax=Clostridium aciditolerans TaxID=339861 RepID=A0A934M4G6_9CLOT|nr:DUF441 domain-containing protein [Clostridium aciditolerans]MBI6872578.1 DUF441 domain-containing protein [Clostridium aciditolerans]
MFYKVVIFFLIIISFVTKNKNLSIAAFVIFVVSLINNQKSIYFIEKYFLDIGMIFLMMWMLVPLIKAENSLTPNIKSLLNLNGLVSFIVGVAVVMLAAQGVSFLKGSVDVLTGVILGSIIGVALLGGVPVGPLIASGIAYEIVRLINAIFKN